MVHSRRSLRCIALQASCGIHVKDWTSTAMAASNRPMGNFLTIWASAIPRSTMLAVLSRRRPASALAQRQPALPTTGGSRLTELTVGFWQDLYKGRLGRVSLGAQYEYLKREAFEGVGGSPSTDDNVFYTSLRYYPF